MKKLAEEEGSDDMVYKKEGTENDSEEQDEKTPTSAKNPIGQSSTRSLDKLIT